MQIVSVYNSRPNSKVVISTEAQRNGEIFELWLKDFSTTVEITTFCENRGIKKGL